MTATAAVRSLSAAYGDRLVFAGVTLTLEPGTLTAVIGPNGSGKSTLLRAFAGEVKPREGTVDRPSSLALITSSQAPPPDVTPRDLAGYGLALRRPWWQLGTSSDDVRAVDAALESVGLTAQAESAVSTLSDGEVQRSWIAAALAIGARTLLIDEPTSHLDLRYQLEVLRTLKALARGGVAVAAAVHDLSLAARFADVIALIAHGRLVAGRPESILDPQAIRDAFGVEVAVFPHPTEGHLLCVPT